MQMGNRRAMPRRLALPAGKFLNIGFRRLGSLPIATGESNLPICGKADRTSDSFCAEPTISFQQSDV
jgi:hypothetical protein